MILDVDMGYLVTLIQSACSEAPPCQRPTALENRGGGEDVKRARAGAGGVSHSGGATPDGQGHLRDLGKLAVRCGLTLGIMALTNWHNWRRFGLLDGLQGLTLVHLQLNKSAFCVIGGTCRGCLEGARGCWGV